MDLCLIHTGGTIGMAATDSGFAPQVGIVERQLIECLQSLKDSTGSDLCCDVIVADPLIDSANATPEDWNWIAAQIERNHAQYDGFVVTHGTDTLAFTAAALSFCLEGLKKPVILTGAMLPLTVSGSDGAGNLQDALQAASSADAGVWVQFAGRRLHGARLRKTHSQAFDAFNASPSDAAPLRTRGALLRHAFGTASAMIAAVAPGMNADLLGLAAEHADGIVLRCYGSGTVPEGLGLRRALMRAHDRGVPVLAVSQCAEGGISLGTYSAGALLQEAGAIDGRDMTVEAAYTKLLLALSTEADFAAQEDLLQTRLCGEWAVWMYMDPA